MSTDAADIVRPELRLELRTALHRALEQGLPSLSLPIPVRFNGTPVNVVRVDDETAADALKALERMLEVK